MAASPKPDYKLIGISSGKWQYSKRGFDKAPQTHQMITWGRRVRAWFVVRYYPSRKGWMATDIREVFEREMLVHGRKLKVWAGEKRGKRVYPTEDAAIMHLMTVMDGTQGKLI